MALHSIAVYCAASPRLDSVYIKAAADVGTQIAQHKKRLVYGGGNTGLMKAVSHACHEHGGEVLGIITEHLKDLELINHNVTEVRIEKDMQSRKMKMFLEADAFIILPGGLGTLEELFEILTWKQIGLHLKPIVFINIQGFWDPLFAMIQKLIKEKATLSNTPVLYETIETVKEMWDALDRSEHLSYDPLEKWNK